MSRTFQLFVAALFAAVMAFSASPARAASVEWKTVDVTLQTEQGQSMLLVSGELPADASLPYETELAVPAGTDLQWIGEILGGPAADDPTLEYTKSTAEGMDVYKFTLTKSRIAQVEGLVQGMSGFDGANYTSSLKWTAWQPVGEVRLNHRIPASAQIVQPATGAETQQGGGGYNYYTKAVTEPKAGDVLDLTFSYALPAAAPASTNAGNSSSTGFLIVILLSAVAGLALVAYKVSVKMAGKNAPAAVSVATTSSRKSSSPSAEESSAESVTEEPDEAEDAPAKRPSPLVPVLVVVGVFVAAFLVAGNMGTSAKAIDGTIKKSFGAASPCASASIPVTPKQGVDLESQGVQLIDAFTGHEGIGDVTLDLKAMRIDMTFCESEQTEASIRQILSGTGLVEPGAAQAPPAL